MKTLRFDIVTLICLAAGLTLALVLKIALLAAGVVPFNADEAVVALMARHILQGARPIFFYGQAYMGSLDAFLVAAGFSIFGQQVWVIRLLQSLLYAGVILTTAWLGRYVFGSWRTGAIAALLLAIPAVNVTLYTTASLGGYGEALLVGNLLLILAIAMYQRASAGQATPDWMWLTWGSLAGLGLWAFGLTLIYSLPCGFLLLWVLLRRYRANPERRGWILVRSAALVLIGGLAGSSPWWYFAYQNGFGQLLFELRGGAIAGVEQLPWLLRIGQHVMNLGLLGFTVLFGLRPPWDVVWLALPLLPFALMTWMGVIAYWAMQLNSGRSFLMEKCLLTSIVATLILAFLFTPFGADPSGRYFVPLAVPLSLFAGDMILWLAGRWGKWAWGLLALILAFNLWGTIQSARRFPPGITTQFYAPTQVDHRYDQTLIEFLNQEGEVRGYTNYWLAYPLAFLSQERIIYVPRLPYHLDFRYTARDDRYPAYDEIVADSNQVAYITSHHPTLVDYLRQQFQRLKVSWEEAQIGDYQVFYRLSRPVRPQEIGLGETTSP